MTKLNYLVLLHIFIITVSNALVHIPLEIFGFKVTWAAFVYPLVIVATDLTVRRVGKDLAAQVVYRAFPFAIITSIIIVSMESDFMFALRIGSASAISYGVGCLIDVHVFQKIRERLSMWWVAPMFSTIISNVIDTYSFCIVAFYHSNNVYMSNNWFEIATNLIFIKIIIGIVCFLPLYGLLLKKIKNV